MHVVHRKANGTMTLQWLKMCVVNGDITPVMVDLWHMSEVTLHCRFGWLARVQQHLTIEFDLLVFYFCSEIVFLTFVYIIHNIHSTTLDWTWFFKNKWICKELFLFCLGSGGWHAGRIKLRIFWIFDMSSQKSSLSLYDTMVSINKTAATVFISFFTLRFPLFTTLTTSVLKSSHKPCHSYVCSLHLAADSLSTWTKTDPVKHVIQGILLQLSWSSPNGPFLFWIWLEHQEEKLA